MKALDALLPSRSAGREIARSGFGDWFSGVTGTDSVFSFNGNAYQGQPMVQTLYGKYPSEPIGSDFVGLVTGALQASGVVGAIELVRVSIFSEVRFQWQQYSHGRPGDLFGTPELALLERPWPGGTTGDLLSRMILHADLAGNSYTTVLDGEMVQLRPDWTDIVLAPRETQVGGQNATVGYKRVGYAYYHLGNRQHRPVVFLPEEVAHFAPMPDPLATYRGMSWLTPVVREIQSDKGAIRHGLAFWEHAATPNLAVSLPKELTQPQFDAFVEAMDRSHKGAANAYKTLYTGGGADVTVIGGNMQQMDFTKVIAAGETRIAAAAGVGAAMANLADGLKGSSLNAGNYGVAKRRFADGTMRPLWRNAAGSLEVLLTSPDPSVRLTYDCRDVAFLREDEADLATIRGQEASTIRTLIDAGFVPESVTKAAATGDWTALKHSGLYSVQLQPPGEIAVKQAGVPPPNELAAPDAPKAITPPEPPPVGSKP